MMFGDVRIAPAELARRVCLEVRAKFDVFSSNPPNRTWTETVTRVLYDIGNQLGYDVYCKHVEKAHEWLLDVVWWKTLKEPSIGVAFAAECEWDYTDLMWDFQKLLCIKAPVKMFIFDGGNSPTDGFKTVRSLRMSVFDQIKSEMLAYKHHVKGETYLFVSFGDKKQYADEVVVPADGALSEIVFEPISVESTTPVGA